MIARAVRLFVFLWISASVAFTALVFFSTRNLYHEPEPGRPATDYRPDIRHCFADDVVLWDCIRKEENKK